VTTAAQTQILPDGQVDIEAFIDPERPQSWSRQMVSLLRAGHYRESYEVLASHVPFVENMVRPYAEHLAGKENHWSKSFEQVKQYVGSDKPQRILDLGCAIGSVAIELARLGHETWGLDVLPSMIARGQELVASLGLSGRTHLVAADVRDLPQLFEEGFFDTVVTRDLFEHLDDASLMQTLDGIKRVIRPGGKLIIETSPSRCYYWFEPTRWKLLALLVPMAWLPDRLFSAYVHGLERWLFDSRRYDHKLFYRHETGHINCLDYLDLRRLLVKANLDNVQTFAEHTHLGFKDEGCVRAKWTRWLFGRKSIACRNVYGVATIPDQSASPSDGGL